MRFRILCRMNLVYDTKNNCNSVSFQQEILKQTIRSIELSLVKLLINFYFRKMNLYIVCNTPHNRYTHKTIKTWKSSNVQLQLAFSRKLPAHT